MLFVDSIPLAMVQHNVPQARFAWAGTPASWSAGMLAVSSVQRADLKLNTFICSAKLDLMASDGVSALRASGHV